MPHSSSSAVNLGGLPTPIVNQPASSPRIVATQAGESCPQPPHIHADVTGIPGTSQISETVRLVTSAGMLAVFAAVICCGVVAFWWFNRIDLKEEAEKNRILVKNEADRNFSMNMEISKQVRDDAKQRDDRAHETFAKMWVSLRDLSLATQEGNKTLQKATEQMTHHTDLMLIELRKIAKEKDKQ